MTFSYFASMAGLAAAVSCVRCSQDRWQSTGPPQHSQFMACKQKRFLHQLRLKRPLIPGNVAEAPQ